MRDSLGLSVPFLSAHSCLFLMLLLILWLRCFELYSLWSVHRHSCILMRFVHKCCADRARLRAFNRCAKLSIHVEQRHQSGCQTPKFSRGGRSKCQIAPLLEISLVLGPRPELDPDRRRGTRGLPQGPCARCTLSCQNAVMRGEVVESLRSSN